MAQRPQVMCLKVPHPCPRHQLPQRAGRAPTWAARVGHMAQAELVHARHSVAVGAAGAVTRPGHPGPLAAALHGLVPPPPLSSGTAAPSKGSPPPLMGTPGGQPKATES